jgi:hypothetical protein
MRNATFESTGWPDGIIQLLDDHHLVVLSDSGRARSQFADHLAKHLGSMSDTEIITIDGAFAIDLQSFCEQLEQQLKLSRIGPNPWWRDVCSVIEVLRHAGSAPKRRYFIWQEAHTMLENDVELFCRLVNAFMGVAAEFEHINLDPLVLQRAVFIGGPKLGAYAEDCNGQFSRWLDDDRDSPFWEVASVIDRPPVLTYRIDG